MKKKILTMALAMCLMVPSSLLLTACDHEHEFGEWQTKTPATCTQAEVEHRTCECGEEETRTGDAALGHSYSSEWSYNTTHHWKDANCGHQLKTQEALHVDEDNNNVCDVCLNGAVASIGTNYYSGIQEAIESITGSEQTVIKLYKSATGAGVVVSGQNIVLDLNGFTYTVDRPLVGSTGTETLGFQLLKGSTVTIKNGTLNHTDGAKMLIQNYCDLTLEDVTIDARNPLGDIPCQYALSNNCGDVVIKGNTNIYADAGQVAFDLWYGMFATYDEGVNVVFDETFTGTVEGKFEYGAAGRASDGWESKAKASIKNGNFNFTGLSLYNTTNPNFSITGGVFNVDISAYCDEGYTAVESDGKYVVVAEQ